MYHARVDEDDKRAILAAFQPTEGTCRIPIAFGMEVDIPDVRTIIHCGPCNDIELFSRECSSWKGRQSVKSNIVHVSRESP